MPLRVKTTDLSIGGLYVELMFTLEVGTKLKIVLWLNDVQVSTGGIVVTRDLQVGNGIKFIDMATEDRLRLKRFLAVAGSPQSPDSTHPESKARRILKRRALRAFFPQNPRKIRDPPPETFRA